MTTAESPLATHFAPPQQKRKALARFVESLWANRPQIESGTLGIAGVDVGRRPLRNYFCGAYQIAELQARSWMVAGTLASAGMFKRTAS